jgi:hypothetical protein
LFWRQGAIAACREETMKRHWRDFVTVPAAGVVLGLLLSVGQVAAADRAPGPEATSGASTSQRANNHADYYADYRANGTDDRAKGTEDDSTPRRDERRDFQQRDWRSAPGTDRYGRPGLGRPR